MPHVEEPLWGHPAINMINLTSENAARCTGACKQI